MRTFVHLRTLGSPRPRLLIVLDTELRVLPSDGGGVVSRVTFVDIHRLMEQSASETLCQKYDTAENGLEVSQSTIRQAGRGTLCNILPFTECK